MMQIRIVIVEDEPATARNLKTMLLDASPNIDVVAMLTGVDDATAWLEKNASEYDLIFMDIRLSDGVSFDIFDKVKIETPVIFVTAYNEYALQAFKANGIDYILKPFDEEELKQSLDKYRRLTEGKHSEDTLQGLQKVINSIRQNTSSYKQSFLVQYRDKLLPLATADIAWFYTAFEVVYAHTNDNRKYTLTYTMEQLEQQLDPMQFFRASRQFIISRKSIREIEYHFNGRLIVDAKPQPQEKILISKAKVAAFKEWLNS